MFAAAYFSFNEKPSSDITETLMERVVKHNTTKFYLNDISVIQYCLCCKNGVTRIIAIKELILEPIKNILSAHVLRNPKTK
jgi:hypothetical protein